MVGLWKVIERFFYSTLSCRVDKWPAKLRARWYELTGRVAGHFHRLHCERCRSKRRFRAEVKEA